MKKLTIVLIALPLLCWLAACHTNNAGNTEPDTTKITGDTAKKATAPSTTNPDSNFAVKADQGGLAELALAKQALAKTGNTRIKDFADMMVVDHTRAHGELTNLMKSKNIPLSGSPDPEHKRIADSLGKLSGTAYNKAFAQVMVNDHKQALSLMEQEVLDTKDTQFKTLAETTARMVKVHLDSIQNIQSSLK